MWSARTRKAAPAAAIRATIFRSRSPPPSWRDSRGRDLLAAIVLAYEIYGRGKALMDADSIWDGITISGVVAPAVAGWLLRLPEDKLAHAIALSAARAATPVAVREGGISAAKNIANALIAQNGMQATLLAQQGVTGPLDLFEAERGLKSGVPARAARATFLTRRCRTTVSSCTAR